MRQFIVYVDSTGWEGEPTSVSVTTLVETICTAVDVDAIDKKSCAALHDEFLLLGWRRFISARSTVIKKTTQSKPSLRQHVVWGWAQAFPTLPLPHTP